MTDPGTPRFDANTNTLYDPFGKAIIVGDTVVNACPGASKHSSVRLYKVDEFVLTERTVPGSPRRTDPLTGGSLYDKEPWARVRCYRWYPGYGNRPGSWNDRRQQIDADWLVKVG